MKLYYSPGACSLAAHITLREAGLPFEAIAAPTKTHRLADGTDYYTLNPLGYVPLLELDDGSRLRETAAILQYLADQAPEHQLAPANGTLARYKLQEWLHFIGSELHKICFSPQFIAGMPDEAKELAKTRLRARLQWLELELGDRAYLMGETFTVADPYLFTVLSWSRFIAVDLSEQPRLSAYLARVRERPAVQATLQAEAPQK